ncbi:MAG: hypothetical protein JW715_02085 [Sedimentisphaerales bacterium]|nr:hypothetical protein [Sedimentisphaerales bacterium]
MGKGYGVYRMRVLLPVLNRRKLPERGSQKKVKGKESNLSIHFISSNIEQVNKQLISDFAPVRQQTSISNITRKYNGIFSVL